MASGGAGVDAAVTASAAGQMVTSTGKLISLPANWATTIPRASLGQAAAKIIKKAGPYGLAAWGLYELLSPMIGLNADGTVAPVTPTGDSDAIYWTNGNLQFASTTPEGVGNLECGGYTQSGYEGAWYADSYGYQTADYSSYACRWSGNPQNTAWSGATYRHFCPGGEYFNQTMKLCETRPVCESGSVWNGQTCVSSSGVPISEPELGQRIAQSPATSEQIFDKGLQDIIQQGLKAKDVGLVPATAPASVTASPVSSPAETVKETTSPNPDGSTTTTTTTEQTTATPHPRGSTAGDAGVDWETSTTTTQTAHNNTSGETKTTTEVTNAGTSTTTTEQPDYCVGHPDLVGCTPVGTLTDQVAPEITSTPLPADFTPPGSVAGSCPAPLTRTLTSGQVVSFDYDPLCTFAGGIRMVVIAMALLGAAYIVSGSVRIDA